MENENHDVDSATTTTADEERPHRRIPRFAIGIVVGVLALALGFLGGTWLAAPRHPGDGSPEAGFARDMSVHHGQAVSMAMMEYRNGGDGELINLAYDIAMTQQNQIGVMDTWLRNWGDSLSSSRRAMSWMPGSQQMMRPDGRMPGMASPAELRQLRASHGRDSDVLFCKLMIKHHLAGVHMADAILKQSKNSPVRKLAQQMVNNQQYEINQLQQKLTELGAST